MSDDFEIMEPLQIEINEEDDTTYATSSSEPTTRPSSSISFLSPNYLPTKKGCMLSKKELESLFQQSKKNTVIFKIPFKTHFEKLFYDQDGNKDTAMKSDPCNFIVCKKCGILLQLETEHHR